MNERRKPEFDEVEAGPAGDAAEAAEPRPPEAAGDAAAPERDLEAEVAALNDKLLRALAEGENLRRRAQREREDTARFAIAGFARDVLAVADNLGRALEALPADARTGDGPLAPFVEGVELTERELQSVFERHGVQKIDPLGQPFDHNLHEAMYEVPTRDAPPGTVVQVVEPGYVLNGRLLRAARVGVAKAPPDAPPVTGIDTTV